VSNVAEQDSATQQQQQQLDDAARRRLMIDKTRQQLWAAERAGRANDIIGELGRVNSVVEVVWNGAQRTRFDCSVYRPDADAKYFVACRTECCVDTTSRCVVNSNNLSDTHTERAEDAQPGASSQH